jgi:hypothetical protein
MVMNTSTDERGWCDRARHGLFCTEEGAVEDISRAVLKVVE